MRVVENASLHKNETKDNDCETAIDLVGVTLLKIDS